MNVGSAMLGSVEDIVKRGPSRCCQVLREKMATEKARHHVSGGFEKWCVCGEWRFGNLHAGQYLRVPMPPLNAYCQSVSNIHGVHCRGCCFLWQSASPLMGKEN